MATKRKTWAEKMNVKNCPRVEILTIDWGGMKKGDKMLISSPHEIQDYINKIPRGKTKAPETMRLEIAHEHGADGMCPLTGGIFLRIVSEEAIDELNQGKVPEDITPFWRIVKPESPLSKKLAGSFLPPFTSSFINDMRKIEGIR